MKLVRLGRFLLALIFPEHCPFCDELSRNGEPCERCAMSPPERGTPRRLPGTDCLCYAPFRYRGAARRSVLHFKFHGRRDYAAYFGRQVAGELRLRIDPSGCVLVPVPLSRERLRERGYNQSLLVARAAAEELGIPCRELLEKTKQNATQHELARAERRKNVEAVYRVKTGKAMDGRIILLDDIVTTGYTLAACVAALENAGGRVCCCAAIAENSRSRETASPRENGNP